MIRLESVQIAQIIHGAMVELRRCIGQDTPELSYLNKPWDELSEERRKGFVHGVEKTIDFVRHQKRVPTPAQCHDMWMDYMLKDGWRYGERFDATEKTHPNLVPANLIPVTELWKDSLFISIVAVFVMTEGHEDIR